MFPYWWDTLYLVSSCWHQSKHSLFASWQTKAWFPYLVAQFFLTSYVQQCHTKTYNMAWSLKWLPNISMPFLITTGRNFVIPAIVTICNNCSSDTPNPESMNPELFHETLPSFRLLPVFKDNTALCYTTTLVTLASVAPSKQTFPFTTCFPS